MGANFETVKFNSCTTAELEKKFNILQEDYCDQYGTDTYAGHIGIATGLNIINKQFKDSKTAHEWLSDNTEKWGPALAVKVGDFSNVFPKTDSDKKLAASFAELSKTIGNWDTDIIKRVKAGKSLQRTCAKCASKITVSYIKSNACPVCADKGFLQTETDDKKLTALKLKYNDMQKKMDEAKQKSNEKNKDSYWLVGALCAD